MNRAILVRVAALYLPAAVTVALWLWRSPDRRSRASALLAGAWCLACLPAVHVVALRLGWWRFNAEGGLFLGLPVDFYFGWALAWGPAMALAFPTVPLAGVLAVALVLDLVLMPAMSPVLVLGRSWLWGELASLVVVLLPAQLLARWTRLQRRLAGRATLQAILFSGLVVGVLPALVLQLTAGSLEALRARPGWLVSLSLQAIVLAAIPGLSAVQEFCERGLGTPLPYDPPRRLVTSGVYAYVANPMQISTVLVVSLLGVCVGSPWIAAGGAIALAYGAGLAAWHEDAETAARLGRSWTVYRSHVRSWLPRWRPWCALGARLYVARGCRPCSEVGGWLRRLEPAGIDIVAAEDHPARDLRRMTYEASDGSTAEGVAALARALEHVHLGWAFVGWAARLPLVRPLLQIVFDGVGAGPRTIPRGIRATECPNGVEP
jgi:protein-S-isoprenylcysteine O-methyltransferase Ste14